MTIAQRKAIVAQIKALTEQGRHIEAQALYAATTRSN